jgi:hypothetical protein
MSPLSIYLINRLLRHCLFKVMVVVLLYISRPRRLGTSSRVVFVVLVVLVPHILPSSVVVVLFVFLLCVQVSTFCHTADLCKICTNNAVVCMHHGQICRMDHYSDDLQRVCIMTRTVSSCCISLKNERSRCER